MQSEGVVSYVGEKTGYGIVVEVDHGDGLTSRYAAPERCRSDGRRRW